MPARMSLESTACAIAARAEGYGGLADIIIKQKLAPAAIASMLRRCSAAKDSMSLAVIVLAAGTARHHADPHHWNGEVERELALNALSANDAAFKRAASRAAKIVAEHWQEIASEA
jgi:hypothetical protein